MKLWRWISAALCACVLLSSLTGCGAADTGSATPSREPDPTATTSSTTTTSTTASTATTTTTTTTTTVPPTTTSKTATTTSKTTKTTASASADKRLKAILADAAQKYGAVGMQMAILSGGEVIHTAQYGWAQKNAVPVSADTMYRVASLTKTVISMVAHRLMDEGKLALDDDISDYLGVKVRHPSYPNVPITVRMLLSHTSALKETDINALTSPAKWRAHLTSGKAFTKNKPGTTYAYNNFAFSVLGTVCEYAANTNFTDLAEAYFFRPMGIDATFMRGCVPKKKFGILYTANGQVGMGMRENQGHDTYFKNPGYSMFCFPGNLFISASDYARLLWVLMNNGVYEGKTLLSPQAVASIQAVQYERGEDGFGQCLPVWRWDGHYGQATLYCHTGNTHGMYSMYVYNPTTGTAVVVCTSGAKGTEEAEDIFAVCSRVIGAVYEDSDLFFGTGA